MEGTYISNLYKTQQRAPALCFITLGIDSTENTIITEK